MSDEKMDADQVRVGPYLVQDLLGSGPHGNVYRVLHEEQNRPLALKRLHEPARGRPGDTFNRIARVVVALTHPMIVDVGHIVMHGDHVAIISDLVDGRSLADLLTDEGALDAGNVMELARQLCAGLQFSHQRCVYHTSLCPGNVFVLSDGSVRITDFAIAALYGTSVRHRPRYTHRHEIFFAPEFREKGVMNPLTDVYSFGVLLYAVLVGGLPMASGSSEAKRFSYLEFGGEAREGTELPELDLAKLPSDTPQVLRDLIGACISSEIGPRLGSMNAVGEMLRQSRSGRRRSSLSVPAHRRGRSTGRGGQAEDAGPSEPRVHVCTACGRPVSPAGRACLACGLVLKTAVEQTEEVGYFHRHGRRLMDRGDFKAAESAYRRSIERNPAEAILHNELGDLLAVQNRFSEAVESYHGALEIDPQDTDTWHDLGVCLAVLNRRRDAREALERAVAQSKRDEVRLSALIHLGAIAADEGRLDDAIRTWLSVLNEEPALVPVRMALASAYATLHNFDCASEQLRAVLAVAPETREAQNLLSRLRERAQLERQDVDRSFGLTDDLGGGQAYLGPGFSWMRLR